MGGAARWPGRQPGNSSARENSRGEEYHKPMASSAAAMPDERSTLCEGCGYTLDGLPDESNCPECGRPISESTSLERRRLPEWESSARAGGMAFVRATIHGVPR